MDFDDHRDLSDMRLRLARPGVTEHVLGGVEIKMADGIFIKAIPLPVPSTVVGQHSHKYDHTSMVATGGVRVWEDGWFKGDFFAPCGLLIKAGVEHQFMSLLPDTLVYCIHNIERTGEVEVLEEATAPQMESP